MKISGITNRHYRSSPKGTWSGSQNRTPIASWSLSPYPLPGYKRNIHGQMDARNHQSQNKIIYGKVVI